MRLHKRFSKEILPVFLGLVFLAAGCASPGAKGSNWISASAAVEPEWIRNGEPVEFEGEFWYPADSVENLLNSEVYQVGEYRGIQVFVDYTDVKPYDRLYTKFSNKNPTN